MTDPFVHLLSASSRDGPPFVTPFRPVVSSRLLNLAGMSLGMLRKSDGPDWKGALMILAVIGLLFLLPALCVRFEIL